LHILLIYISKYICALDTHRKVLEAYVFYEWGRKERLSYPRPLSPFLVRERETLFVAVAPKCHDCNNEWVGDSTLLYHAYLTQTCRHRTHKLFHLHKNLSCAVTKFASRCPYDSIISVLPGPRPWLSKVD
jgi:hypothetical protein